MIVALDANILLRKIDAMSPHHIAAAAMIQSYTLQGHDLVVFPQALVEFWVVGTRPVANNGLGLSVQVCDTCLDDFLSTFDFLPDHPMIIDEWRKLVLRHSCSGKPAHDARYVAAMNTHVICDFMTFNTADFRRYPGITLHDPASIPVQATTP